MVEVEVVVVGGGAAGLSAALAAVRARRRVVVLDADAPRNASAPAVHGLLGHDGVAPRDLRATAIDQLRSYASEIVIEARVTAITGDGDGGFLLERADGVVRAERVILATGMRDVLPGLPGFARLWGRCIIHCSYCHGWEVAGRRWGVVTYDRPAVAAKLELFRNWTDDLVLFVDPVAAADVPVDDADRVESRRIIALLEDGYDLTGVRLAGGVTVPVGALVWPVPQRLPELVADLGLRLDGHGHVAVDDGQRTSVPGIYAAGDLASYARQQVVHAAASGVLAAKAVVEDLTLARRRRAVAVG